MGALGGRRHCCFELEVSASPPCLRLDFWVFWLFWVFWVFWLFWVVFVFTPRRLLWMPLLVIWCSCCKGSAWSQFRVHTGAWWACWWDCMRLDLQRGGASSSWGKWAHHSASPSRVWSAQGMWWSMTYCSSFCMDAIRFMLCAHIILCVCT